METKLPPHNCVAYEGMSIPLKVNLVQLGVKFFSRGILLSPFTMYVAPWHKNLPKSQILRSFTVKLFQIYVIETKK